jgi:hypothetical protein
VSGATGLRLAALVALAALAAAGCGEDDNPQTPPPTGGRTIHFPGDAATLQAAVDMAVRGDTVLVEAGTHTIDTSLVIGDARDGVTLAGRLDASPKSAGAERPVLDLANALPQTGIAVRSTAEDVTIRGLEIRGDLTIGVDLLGPRARLVDCRIVAPSYYCVACGASSAVSVIEGNLLLDAVLFGVACSGGAIPTIVGNTIVGAGDCGIISTDASPVCERNIVFGSTNFGVACFSSEVPARVPSLDCNAFFGNGSDYSFDCVPGAGDFHADPIFCDVIGYEIASTSPCTPDSSGGCGLIGAAGVGCSPP